MSKREEILALRDAWLDGANWASHQGDPYWLHNQKLAEAASRYPLTEKRARLIEFRETTYRVTNNKLEFQMSDTTWIEAAMQQDIILQLVDLFRHPTEEVEL